MIQRFRLLLGISLLWLVLSLLSDGLNTLILPYQVAGRVGAESQATVLGLVSFFGILAGMFVQPIAGAFSDWLRPAHGRQRFIGAGVLLTLLALAFFGAARSLLALILGYLALQITLSIAQAGQQGLLPDRVPGPQRGLASGLKIFMDLSGAMFGFLLLGELLGSGRLPSALGLIGIILIVLFLFSLILIPRERRQIPSLPQETKFAPISQAFQLDWNHDRNFIYLVTSRFLFLLATYAIGRFLLLFVAGRLSLGAGEAAQLAGSILAGLALVTVLGSPFAGWAADRLGRVPLMVIGAVLSALGVLLLVKASSPGAILLFGSLMSLGSAAFSSANWAMTADVAPPKEAARFFGLANFGTAGAAAAAGLFGPLVDWSNHLAPGSGFPALFITAALIFLTSAWVLRAIVDPGRTARTAGFDVAVRDQAPKMIEKIKDFGG